MTAATAYRWASGGEDVPTEVTVTVVEALVPALVWHSVPVVRQVEEELTIVDRFVLHSAMAMGATGPAEIHEVTGIAEPAVARIGGRLVDLGLLVRDGEGYQPVGSQVRPALDGHAVRQVRTERWSFLHLPYRDDVIAFDPGGEGGTVVRLHDVSPCAVAPVPAGLAGAVVSEFLAERARAGRIAGLPDGLTEIADTGQAMPAECPVYRCRGTVERDGDGPVARLDVLDPADPDGRRGLLVLAGGALVAGWEELAGDLDPALERWRADGGETAIRVGDHGGPEIRLNAAALERAAREGVAVSRPATVTVHAAQSVLETVVSLRPADPSAAERFAIDDAVQSVLETEPAGVDEPSLSGLLDAVAEDHEVPRAALTEARLERQLWSGGHFRHLYAARAARDFGYA